MTCKECIHYNACKFTYIEAFGSFNEEQFGQTGCAEFEDKSRFVEVVRCKDCKYWQDNNGGYPHEECRWGKEETPDADDFCSYGERKEYFTREEVSKMSNKDVKKHYKEILKSMKKWKL